MSRLLALDRSFRRIFNPVEAIRVAAAISFLCRIRLSCQDDRVFSQWRRLTLSSR